MIYCVKDHEEFIALNGGAETLRRIQADPEMGYAVNLSRG